MIPIHGRPKRPRDNSYATLMAKDVVNQLHEAVTPQHTLSVTQRLLDQLRSNEVASVNFYNSLLHAGVPNALCLHLGFIFNCQEASQQEFETISSILNVIYRNCTEIAREQSLSEIGADLFCLLLRGMNLGIVVLPMLATLHACSGSMQGTTLLFQCRILSSMAKLFQAKEIENESLLMESLGIMKNISYYGEDHRHEIVEHTALVSRLASIPFSKGANEKIQERLSAFFRNLAVSPNARPLLGHQAIVLSSVARMGSSSSRQTHRNILNFLLSLGQEMNLCVIICLHGDGVLLNIVKRFINETDPIIRKRSVRIIRMLASEGSALLLVHDTLLMRSLAQRALHDISNEVRTEATDAIVRLAGFIKAPMPQHEAILETLTHLVSSPTALPEVLALAFMKQAAEPTNRLPMAERKMLLESLAQIALSKETTNRSKEHICCAIHDLTREEMIREKIATCSIIEALVQNALLPLQDDQVRRRLFGIRALVNLASASSNRKAMATHNRLLQTLVHYAASLPEADVTKEDVKKTILMLVSEL